MANADEILFSKSNLSEPSNRFKILFNTNINWDTDLVKVDVSYLFLNENKTIGETTIYTEEPLIAVGSCEKAGLINVCYKHSNCVIYFWIKQDEISKMETVEEEWEIDEVRKHLKAIREEWTIKKDTKKESKKNLNKEKLTERKEKKRRGLIN